MSERKTGPAWGIEERREAVGFIRKALTAAGSSGLTAHEIAVALGCDDGRSVCAIIEALHLVGDVEPHRIRGKYARRVWAVTGAVVDMERARERLRDSRRSELANCVLAWLRGRVGAWHSTRDIAAGVLRDKTQRVSGALMGLRAARLVESQVGSTGILVWRSRGPG